MSHINSWKTRVVESEFFCLDDRFGTTCCVTRLKFSENGKNVLCLPIKNGRFGEGPSVMKTKVENGL